MSFQNWGIWITIKAGMQSQYSQEVQTGNRFEFGKNWKRFLLTLTEDQIEAAAYSLKRFLDIESLQGKTFLDIGSGSKNTIEGATTKCPKGMSVSIEFRRAPRGGMQARAVNQKIRDIFFCLG